jgi:hypothetical protein
MKRIAVAIALIAMLVVRAMMGHVLSFGEGPGAAGGFVPRRRDWVRLDNASNIFLAARSHADPKVFRISAELDHEVEPRLLQGALDATYDRYRLYHAVLRRGVFWYYLQDSDLRPTVTADDQYTCAPIYRVDRRDLLFRVMHHDRRIILEVFHALSDGIGALSFLSDLITAYVRLRHPGELPVEEPDRSAEPTEFGPVGAGSVGQRSLVPDSFSHYFRRRRPTNNSVADRLQPRQ